MDPKEGKIFTLVLIIGLTLGVIIAYFFITLARHNRRTKKLQRSLMLAELAAMEKERARIATDLHDEVSPILSVVKFQVDSVEAVSAEDRTQLQQASGFVDDMLQRIREISNNLMPSSLLKKGLVAALEEYFDKVEEATGLMIHFTCGVPLLLKEEVCVNIYRIIQEVIHNCQKHAKATEVFVTLEKQGVQLLILIRDNGIGFNLHKVAASSTGIGLRSIRNRAKILGGSMRLESEIGRGTAFLFRIPIT